MSAGDLAKHFSSHDVVAGYDSNKNKAGGYTVGGEESVYPDAAEMANYKEPSYSRARTLSQAYMEDSNVANQIDGWTAQFENGLSRAADDWKPTNDGGFA